jgi:hypothetical protein
MFPDSRRLAEFPKKLARSSAGHPEIGVRCATAPANRNACLTTRPFARRVLTWVSIAIAVLLVAPAVASAFSFPFSGHTSQGLPVRMSVSQNLLTVNRFVVSWRASCTSGLTFADTTKVLKTPVTPFPNFHRAGSYTISGTVTATGQPVTFVVSAHLRGKLLLGGRARGTWTAEVQVLDANQNQIDSCSTGVVDWKAKLT